jgi:tripartite-type tricarboxylate transporter receptor subunit TctC
MRIRLIAALAACVTAAAGAPDLFAQQFPSRPISLVVATTAGGGADIAFRPIAEQLSRVLGQGVVMDFKPGAGSDVASLYVKGRPADGYTLYAASNQVVVRSAAPNAQIDARRDFTPISPIGGQPFMIAVNTDQIKATNIRELMDEARRRPGQINYASYGIGSGAHLLMAMLLNEAQVSMTHVPYKSTAQSVADTVAGVTQVTIGIMPTLAPHVASQGGSGKLRILAVSSQERAPLYPDIPGMRESGSKVDYLGWSGLLAPAGLPGDVVMTLNRALNEAIRDPATAARLKQNGNNSTGGTPEQLKHLIEREYNDYAVLIKETGLRLE